MRITSTANATVKAIRKLASRKHRRRQERFWAEGIRVTLTAFECRAPLEQVVIAPELLAHEYERDVRERAARADVPVLEVSAEVFAGLSDRDGPSGLGVVGRIPHLELGELRERSGVGWIVLDGVQYPGNLGTIVRTADAVRADGVILLEGSTDPYDPTALRASKGAVFGLPVVAVERDALLRWVRRRRLHLVAVTPDGGVDVREAELPAPRAILLGNEQHGVGDDLLAACDARVTLPMAGRVDSLNLAVAAGVVLYELQRRGR